jgi:1-deoxy-D-xylulose-5-phosphate reductoisomerase
MKNIAVLGSTGSIGIQTLDVVRLNPGLFRVVSLSAGRNLDLLVRQIKEFCPIIVSCCDEEACIELETRLNSFPRKPLITHSIEGHVLAATVAEADLVVMGFPGSLGLLPSFQAVRHGKDIALATKEVLVMAGRMFRKEVQEYGVTLLPIDSEQSAIFQCLQGQKSEIRRIILTASGGPFLRLPISEISEVTVERTLDHPRWKMGPKVTVDSSTLMNKGFEVIEAKWLFGVSPSAIEVLIHPQSIVHSMVEFKDGCILAQLGATDMRIPISYALAFPERIPSGSSYLNFPDIGILEFEEPDVKRFPLLKAAIDVLSSGDDCASVVLNAADEAAVDLFLAGKISYTQIARLVLQMLDKTPRRNVDDLNDVEELHTDVIDIVRSEWNRLLERSC